MRGEGVADQPGGDVNPSIGRLSRLASFARIRSFHGSFLCLSTDDAGLAHRFRPDPDDMVFLVRPLDPGGFGLVSAGRPFPLRRNGRPNRLHLVRIVPVPMSDRFLLADPVEQDCILAHQDWHLNKGGPASLGPVLPGPDAQFSFDAATIPLFVDEPTASTMLALIDALGPGTSVEAGGGIDAAAAGEPGLPIASLLGTLLAARRAAPMDQNRLGAVVDSHTENISHVRAPFTPVAAFEHSLVLDPARFGILQQLGGGWLGVMIPNFAPAGPEADRPVKVFATGGQATISFDLPYRPSQARFRLGIAEINRHVDIQVSADGWELGRSRIGRSAGSTRRLDYIIKGEAIQSDRLTIRIDPDRPPGTANRLFLLSGCQLDLGPDTSPAAVPEDPADLLARFESIGRNCEFGFVQRHFGLERLGLLTFAGVRHLTDLMDMLDQGFAGLGAPGSIEANEVVFSVRARDMPPRDVREFWITNRRYRFEMHSFKGPDHHSREEAIRENEMKLSYLSRKLVEDLEDGDKIFVYTDTRDNDLNDLLSLHASLNRYGPNKLFWVTHPVSGRPAGSVEWVAPNLLRGYSFNPHLDVQWFNADHWLLLCRRAFAAFQRAG